MVTDPPFGGLVGALAASFKKLMAMWKETGKEGMYYNCDSCYLGECEHICYDF